MISSLLQLRCVLVACFSVLSVVCRPMTSRSCDLDAPVIVVYLLQVYFTLSRLGLNKQRRGRELSHETPETSVFIYSYLSFHLQFAMQDQSKGRTLSNVVRSVMDERHHEETPSDIPTYPKLHNPLPSTPSARTGVPCSLTHISPSSRQNSSHIENNNLLPPNNIQPEEPPLDPYEDGFYHSHSEFRNALDYTNPEQREKERGAMEKKERLKRRDTWLDNEAWNPRKWLSGFDDSASPREERQYPCPQSTVVSPTSPQVFSSRTASQPQSPKTSPARGRPRWSRLRSLLPQVTGITQGSQSVPASLVAGATVNITDRKSVV